MRSRHFRLRGLHVTAGVALLLVGAIAVSVADRSLAERQPAAAPPAALARVAAKNDAAATLAAARMKAHSEEQSIAAERLRASTTAGAAVQPPTD